MKTAIKTPHIELIDEQMADVLRRKTGAERLQIASGMYASARRMLMSHLQAENPKWQQEQIVRETARRLSHGAF